MTDLELLVAIQIFLKLHDDGLATERETTNSIVLRVVEFLDKCEGEQNG